jgi:hypothetical protein
LTYNDDKKSEGIILRFFERRENKLENPKELSGRRWFEQLQSSTVFGDC